MLLSLTKVAVVVERPKPETLYFTGKSLTVANTQNGLLIIKDGTQERGVFNVGSWLHWYKVPRDSE
jgi:hypothetical protein